MADFNLLEYLSNPVDNSLQLKQQLEEEVQSSKKEPQEIFDTKINNINEAVDMSDSWITPLLGLPIIVVGNMVGTTTSVTATPNIQKEQTSFEAQNYNTGPLSEQKTWDKNFNIGKEAYINNTLNKKQQYNATQFNAVLSKSKDSFKDDLKYLNIDYEDFVEKMMGIYSAETSFGLNEKKISKTGARGELQVTLETLKDIIKPKGNFGPKMAKAAGVDLKKLRAMSDKELNNLLLNDNRFNYLIGSAVMLNKLQYRTKK